MFWIAFSILEWDNPLRLSPFFAKNLLNVFFCKIQDKIKE
jgi:hypothetical protein